jgi:hypothetical protein
VDVLKEEHSASFFAVSYLVFPAVADGGQRAIDEAANKLVEKEAVALIITSVSPSMMASAMREALAAAPARLAPRHCS